MDSLDTLREVFTNKTLAPERLEAPFGVCYVAFAGTHKTRYRGERLLEVASRQLTAAASARGGAQIPQCVVTDQPERSRPYLQHIVPLRTSLDVSPFAARCTEYTRLFNRPCKLLFGYMAKAIAVARAPYSTSIFLDTDTFVCDAALLLALGTRLMWRWDVLLLMPRTSQGWVNSGVLAVHRESARAWAMAWQREFTSLDDFGDQLHLLKVLPLRSDDADGAVGGADPLRAAGVRAGGSGRGSSAVHPAWGRAGGGRGASARRTRGALAVGELPPELHVRVGSVSEDAVGFKLPALRGPAMLLHSKGLASLSNYAAFFAERFGVRGAMADAAPAQRQLMAFWRDDVPEAKRKGEHNPYSARSLAGFCALLNEGWAEAEPDQARPHGTKRLQLNSQGNCTGCTKLAHTPNSVGVIHSAEAPPQPYVCSLSAGDCGLKRAAWPDGSEKGLPEWYRRWLERSRGGSL